MKLEINKLKQNKTEIHVRSIFLQGLLLKNEKSMPRKFKKWKNIFKKWNNYCKKENISKVQGCVNFIKSFKKISFVIIGFEDIKQVKNIISYFKNDRKSYTTIACNDIRLIDPRLW